jgi:hypothetical protein
MYEKNTINCSYIIIKTPFLSPAQWLTPAISATQRWRSEELWFQVGLGKKFSRPCLNQWLGTMVLACHPSYPEKHTWDSSPDWPWNKARP